MKVARKASSTYWAQVWNWRGADLGGYLGLQTDGNRGNGTTGDTAVFSLWNATAAKGPNCGVFGGEGTGYSCRLGYSFGTNTYYRLRVWRLGADTAGQWWGAWVKNTTTGADTYLGSIRVGKRHTLMSDVANFAEYFGTAVACNRVPMSQFLWNQPAANSRGNGVYDYGSRYVSRAGDRGDCTGGSSTPVRLSPRKGVKVTLGGAESPSHLL